MSKSALRKKNKGAYTSPFSGVGTEFYPLGISPDLSGLVLHETGFLPCNDWWNFPNVLSPFWRLIYDFQKGHTVIFKHCEYPLSPEHLMLIPDYQLFNCRGTTAVASFWMAFSTCRRLAPAQAIPILLRPTALEMGLINAMPRFFRKPEEKAHRLSIFHHSLALLNLVLDRPELSWLNQSKQENIVSVVRHIERAFSEPLTIPQLAKMAGLSVRGFSKAFKASQGITAARFITRERVREAAQLLANTGKTLDEIASVTGFPNRYYFGRVFKQVTGESPAFFRNYHGASIVNE